MSKEDFRVYIALLKSLAKHKAYVLIAGIKLGVPIRLLIIHDWRKLTKQEFKCYAHEFYGSSMGNSVYAHAWLHHENFSPHHPGHWIPRTGKYKNKPLEMPEVHAREMIADWMGANKANRDSWDMVDWLNENFIGIRLHENTRDKIILILIMELGYRYINEVWCR